jgi:predicted DNA-binding transcriptional regulator AlpA
MGCNVKRLLPIKEAAEYLGIARQSLYNRLARNAKDPFPVRPVRIFGKPLFDMRDLDRYIDQQKAAQAGGGGA